MLTITVIYNHSYIDFDIKVVSTSFIHGNSSASTDKAGQLQVVIALAIKPVLITSKRGQSFSVKEVTLD